MNTEILSTLRSSLPCLASRDREFAASLIEQFDRKGSLSERQWPWVEKLAAKASTPAEEKPAPRVDAVGDMSGLTALFDKAKSSGIKYPKIRIDVDGETVVLALAGERSQHAGAINVQSPGSFESREWYGRVSPKGEFTRSARTAPNGLLDTLVLLATDPAKAGKIHGQRTGNCCFCAKDLTDGRSVSAGYGPICADKWGLPWGE